MSLGIGASTEALSTAEVRVDGYTTRYLEAGQHGGTPVVLLHGSGPGVSAATNWSATIPALAERFHVYAPEMLGFGGTDRARELAYTTNGWVDHVVGFLDALGIAKAHLVGNSLGGVVTLHTVLRHRDRVGRIVLMGTPGLGMRMTAGLKALRAYE
ncbi:alpha/beta fold hydrolase, partial [Streptomyces sp. NPDC002920]